MKKLTTLILFFAFIPVLCACSNSGQRNLSILSSQPSIIEQNPKSEPVELIVFAAASMSETMNQIADMYKKVAPNVTLIYTFDSSGTLKTQIEEGADCDLFISAAQKQMDQLDITADPKVNDKGLDFVLQDTRINLVENKVALVVPEGNPAGITAFEDVATSKVSLIALGNSDVPVGQYAQEIFTYLGIWEKLNSEKKITFGTNVKEVISQVSAGSVDCGVVYGSDAASAGLEIVAYAPEGSHKPVIYLAAVMKNSKNQEAAKEFLAYLLTAECSAVFESVGLTIPPR